jgi:Leucine-rich repeat (LRR) protein
LLREIKERDAKPRQVEIGTDCTKEDFAQVCAWPWIRELRIESRNLTELRPLAQRPELTSLTLFNLKQTEKQPIDIGALSALKDLEKIEFYASHVVSTDALASLSKLKDLSINMSDFESLDFLNHSPGIEKLNLSGHGHTFEDYKPVLHLENLKALDISGNPQATDSKLKDLEVLSTLEKFSMARCFEVTTLAFLRNCKGLRELNADSARGLENLSVLAEFTQLEKLDLSDTPIEDLSFLQGKQKLKDLDLSETQVTNVSVLSESISLERLILAETGITDFSALEPLENIQELVLPKGVSEDQLEKMNARWPKADISVSEY